MIVCCLRNNKSEFWLKIGHFTLNDLISVEKGQHDSRLLFLEALCTENWKKYRSCYENVAINLRSAWCPIVHLTNILQIYFRISRSKATIGFIPILSNLILFDSNTLLNKLNAIGIKINPFQMKTSFFHVKYSPKWLEQFLFKECLFYDFLTTR